MLFLVLEMGAPKTRFELASFRLPLANDARQYAVPMVFARLLRYLRTVGTSVILSSRLGQVVPDGSLEPTSTQRRRSGLCTVDI
jgi:hypothetical protein